MGRNPPEGYGGVAKVVPWLTFVFRFGNAWFGLYMNDLPKGPQTEAVYARHWATGASRGWCRAPSDAISPAFDGAVLTPPT